MTELTTIVFPCYKHFVVSNETQLLPKFHLQQLISLKISSALQFQAYNIVLYRIVLLKLTFVKQISDLIDKVKSSDLLQPLEDLSSRRLIAVQFGWSRVTLLDICQFQLLLLQHFTGGTCRTRSKVSFDINHETLAIVRGILFWNRAALLLYFFQYCSPTRDRRLFK